jgi:hypothetical protein
MLVGHHAVGFAAKRLAPRVSLGTLQAAAVFPDLLVLAFQMIGVEHARNTPGITAYAALDAYDVAISHSLVTGLLWSGALAAIYFWWRRDTRGAWVISGVVLSHWLLDFVSHRPEMPLAPGLNQYVGLGLWNSIPATFLVEGTLWVVGIAVYMRTRPALTKRGLSALATFIGVLTLAWIAIPFAPLPPGDFTPVRNLTLLVVSGTLITLAGWIDRQRRSEASQSLIGN